MEFLISHNLGIKRSHRLHSFYFYFLKASYFSIIHVKLCIKDLMHWIGGIFAFYFKYLQNSYTIDINRGSEMKWDRKKIIAMLLNQTAQRGE